MLPGVIQFNNDNFQAVKIGFINKTGGALVKGGVYALDVNQADAYSTTAQKSLFALKAVAAGNINGVLVVAEKATPSGEVGEGVVFGPCDALVEGTTDVAAGDRLKATAAQNYLAKASAAVGSVDVGVGMACGAQAANSSVLTKVLFDGIAFNKVINAAVS